MSLSVFPGVERRKSVRSPVLPNRARLEWWEQGERHSSSARLIDISLEGAMLCTDEPLHLDQTVWCHLEEPARADWIKMHVTWRGEHREVGVSFLDSCPDDLFLAATLGINPASLLLRELSTTGGDHLD